MANRSTLVAAMLSASVAVASALAAQPSPVQQPVPKPPPHTLPTPVLEPAAPAVKPPAKPLTVDYKALFEQEQQKNRRLEDEVHALRQRLLETIHPGGGLVHAYCESDTVSRNTAGARSDCGAAGYGCEPVSGLCRTSCQGSGMCAPGFICDPHGEQCVKP